jgi:MFS family permease
MSTSGPGEVSRRREVEVISLMTLAKFLVTTDFYILSLILPSIANDLHLSQVMVSWVVAAQGLFYAGFMVLAGRLADILGQRRGLIVGLLVFASGAALAALAPNVWVLIGARSLQGLGAAVVAPSAFSLITTLLPEGKSRHRALGVFSLTQGLSVIVGLLVAGAVVRVFGWRSAFLINTPLMVGAFILTLHVVPKGPIARTDNRVDLAGASLIPLSIGLLLSALTLFGRYGFGFAPALGLAVAAIAGVAAFVAVERRAPVPLVPLKLVRRPSVIGGCLTGIGVIAAGGSTVVLTNFYMAVELHYTPLQAGAAALPYALGILISGAMVPLLMARFSNNAVIVACVLIEVVGIGVLSFVDPQRSYFLTLGPGLLLCSFGANTAWAGLMNWSTRAVPAAQQGVTSGMLLMFQQVGVPLGAAIVLGVVGARRSGVPSVGLEVYRTAYLCTMGFATFGLSAALVSMRVLAVQGRTAIAAAAKLSEAAGDAR